MRSYKEILETIVHGTTPRISVRTKHLDSMPTEEVPLRTKASLACLEREDHVAPAWDGLYDVEIRFLTVRPKRLTWAG